MVRNSGCRTAGFSLLEAVVALTVVGLTAVAVLGAFGSELRAAEKARTALEVEALAQDRLVAVRLLPAGELAPISDSVAHGTFEEPFSGYQWTTRVSSVSLDPGVYDVFIEVKGESIVYPLWTRIYRPPPLLPR